MKARENPFRVERLHQLPFLFPQGNMTQLIDELVEVKFRGAIVGPHGSGKTTLLTEIMDELKRRELPFSHLRLQDDGRAENNARVLHWLESSLQSSILILDSAGLLGWYRWRKLDRSSLAFAGLLITAHRPGRMQTLLQCTPSLQTLNRLIESLELDFPLHPSQLAELFTRHHGNLRDCLRELYDRYANEEFSR